MEDLVDSARQAMDAAYAPHSEYSVGAALRAADGSVFTGWNVENANYSNSIHAEELAISKAVERGVREFDTIAVEESDADRWHACLRR
jgi:cytidine deaminase